LTKLANDCSDGITVPLSTLQVLSLPVQHHLTRLTLLANVSAIKSHFKSTWDDTITNDLQHQMNHLKPELLCHIKNFQVADDDAVGMPQWMFKALRIKVGDQVSVSIDLSQM
jgi:hypothetical protein